MRSHIFTSALTVSLLISGAIATWPETYYDASGPSTMTVAPSTDLRTSTKHCGACGQRCDKPGQYCRRGVCKCPKGQTMCDGWCKDLKTNREHCGKCNNLCPPGIGCIEGVCKVPELVCPKKQTVCNHQCVSLFTDPYHCGGCNKHCNKPGQTCMRGRCKCPRGQTMCDGWCQNLKTNREHCGKCGNVCPPGIGCNDGVCGPPKLTCSKRQIVCNHQCVDPLTDQWHCGGCNQHCNKPGQTCVNGRCMCPVGMTMCDGWCQDLKTNREHCGKCGNLCDPGFGCTNGVCDNVCPDGKVKCNNQCVDLKTNKENCGQCGNVCHPGSICSHGTCEVECPGGDCHNEECPEGQVRCSNGECASSCSDAPSWSVSYTQGFWRNSFCTGTNACGTPNAPSACDVVVPAWSNLDVNLRIILNRADTCAFTTNGHSSLLRSEMCSCLSPSVGSGQDRNAVAFVLNMLLGGQPSITQPDEPTDLCPDASYTQLAATYVCTKQGSATPCPCPTTSLSNWNSELTELLDLSARNQCYDFVNNAVDEGQCMPSSEGADYSDRCVLQSSPCSGSLEVEVS